MNLAQNNLSDSVYSLYQSHEMTQIPLDSTIWSPATPSTANYAASIPILGHYISLQAANQNSANQTKLFDLMKALEQVVYEPDLMLTDTQQANIGQWRDTKAPENLINAGVDYLLVDTEWLGWLAPASLAILQDPTQYELIHEWLLADIHVGYWLYRAIPSDEQTLSN